MKNLMSIGAASAFTLALTLPGHAGTVTLGNGDVIEGEVVSNGDAGVEIVHKSLGTLNIAADNVAGVALSNADPAYTGGGDEGWFFPGWDKRLTAGTSGTVADTDTLNFNASFSTAYADDNKRWDIDVFYIYAETESDETANWFSAQVTRDWLAPGEAYFYWASARFQINTQRAYDERTSGFVGAGYQFINRPDDFELLGRVGAGLTYDAGNINELTPEILFGLEAKWTIDERSSLTAFTQIIPSLDPAFSDFRKEAGATYSLAIATARGLSFEAEVLFDFDSSIPSPGEESAVSYLAALVYDF